MSKPYLDYSREQIEQMDYVSFMGVLDENNRPPGGKKSIREILQNCFLTQEANVLHVGCNTGYSSFEIAHLLKCRVTGIDLNQKMIEAANHKLSVDLEEYRNRLCFQVGDARHLPFPDKHFDLVFSAGSTAFMADREQCLAEFKRVCKPYGFIADTFLFYPETPPTDLLVKINNSIGINIQPWNERYWTDAYRNQDLETYYYKPHKMETLPTDDEVKRYCESMISRSTLSEEVHEIAINKLYFYMDLFNQNHRYLNYAVLIMRNSPEKEQISLFGS